MVWEYWMALFTETHSLARGLSVNTILAYKATLERFRNYVRFNLEDKAPDEIAAVDVLAYINHLKTKHDNKERALNRQATILSRFYKAMVAMGHMEYRQNPMNNFPKLKGPARKLPTVLSEKEVEKLLDQPRIDTVIGLRDRAMLMLLYCSAIRASECANLKEENIDFTNQTIMVTGKGGDQRIIHLHEDAIKAMLAYRLAREQAGRGPGFFVSRFGRTVSRNTVYDRVRKYAREARMQKHVTPHTMRHSCATHLLKKGVCQNTIAEILGHRCVASTNVYLHITSEDLREAAATHPVGRMLMRVAKILPGIKLPFQNPPGTQYAFG